MFYNKKVIEARDSEIADLKKEIEHLRIAVAEQKEKLDGGRVCGAHCEHCEHGMTVFSPGFGGNFVSCELKVRCKDFERR